MAFLSFKVLLFLVISQKPPAVLPQNCREKQITKESDTGIQPFPVLCFAGFPCLAAG